MAESAKRLGFGRVAGGGDDGRRNARLDCVGLRRKERGGSG
uniref:Uncharacterized protein n=1 Tax=Arundo donax TaxID=35708 RepID=A0A0A9GA12_ARUDO